MPCCFISPAKRIPVLGSLYATARQLVGMIDAAALGLMQKHALLINVARGPVVREADLVTALEQGALGGAGLDVTEIEPLSSESRLWDLPNVIITPHVGAQSANRVNDTTKSFVDLIDQRNSTLEPVPFTITHQWASLACPRPHPNAKINSGGGGSAKI